MWDERGLYQHSLRKKETRQIIDRIEARQYLHMRSHRSEGSEVAIDYAIQLRHAVRKSKTEKLTFHRHLRDRLITELSQPAQRASLQLHELRTPSKALPENERQQQSEQDQQDQSAAESSEKSSRIEVYVEDNISSELTSNGEKLQPGQQINSESLTRQVWAQFAQSDLLSKNHQKKHFLPMLEVYIQELTALKYMSPHERRVRNLIVTMMVLAINRRQNNSLLDALDILLQTEIYFPRENKEMVHLKSVWLSLIGKIYQEVSKTLKVNTGSGRWRKTTRKSSIRSTQQAKRQKTIFIRSLASRKSFLDKFSQNLRKSKLLYESTYLMELRNELNATKIEEGKRIISKISPQLSVSYPEPQELYPDTQNIMNYAIVMVSKDKEANLFPLNYPESLTSFISKQDYTSKIIKINSYLIPTARCMNFHSALFFNFELILSILVILFISAILMTSSLSRITAIGVMAFAIISFCLASGRIHIKSDGSISFMSQMGQVGQLLEKYLQQWAEEYKQSQIKFILDSACDVFIISFPIDADQGQEQEELSSFAFEPHQSKQDTHPKMDKDEIRKCSIKLPTQSFKNPLADVDEDSSEDNELNQQFWREIEAKKENMLEYSFKQEFEKQNSEQSQDEVVGQPRGVIDDLEVQLVVVGPPLAADSD